MMAWCGFFFFTSRTPSLGRPGFLFLKGGEGEGWSPSPSVGHQPLAHTYVQGPGAGIPAPGPYK